MEVYIPPRPSLDLANGVRLGKNLHHKIIDIQSKSGYSFNFCGYGALTSRYHLNNMGIKRYSFNF